ncbi:metalloregulator ArsR/SmtB family transcription factor [Thaumasiovibrio subtropicus]|uniref:metalloregulator ArsR/SmtB family transcription factor n=1 Tax=Thaumasiovibrio subtropicus TaxID=1891207 RepID=UPI000B35FDB6|nr:metalloregulator ArsR/SmtB family transcription factor [Thaumasiovibrio subtropicus]
MLPHRFFKMLSDETRVRCLLLIARHERSCVCDIMTALDESQPKISRHLAQLRQSDVLIDERQGQWVYYSLSPNLPGWARKIIDGLGESNCLLSQYQQDNDNFLSQQSEDSSVC